MLLSVTTLLQKFLSVVFTQYRKSIPFEKTLSYRINLADHLPKKSRIGFSAANPYSTSQHVIRSWSFNSKFRIERTDPNHHPNFLQKTFFLRGVSTIGSLIFFTVVFLIIFLVLRRKKRIREGRKDHGLPPAMGLSVHDDWQRNCGAKKFFYDELCSAINNFAEEEKLGEGGFGFGGVYRGFLKSFDSFVAIKKVSKLSLQGLKEYASEVKIISQLRHRNLVQLIGWCHQKQDLLLVYEFMSNGSLDSHLFNNKSLLPWATRYNIARGLASAMLYLHEECEQSVLHRDIKSSNVMLDSNFNAKLGDFGLARLMNHDKGFWSTTMLAGTMDYMAPEYILTRKPSKASDVFSFGIVALELACGRKSVEHSFNEDRVSLVEWVWDFYGSDKLLDVVDERLSMEFDVKQIETLLIVGLWCVHPDHNLRPSIKQAIRVLLLESPFSDLPMKRPVPNFMFLYLGYLWLLIVRSHHILVHLLLGFVRVVICNLV